MSQQAMRVFSTEFKEGVVLRLEAGERLASVADALTIRRKLLYEWRAAYRRMGVAGLNRKRGPKPGYLAARASPDAAPGPDASSELARAKRASPSWSARSASSRWTSIFFAKPCGSSTRWRSRRPRPARRPLLGHRNDERAGETQGGPSIDHLCALANVSRAGFYRFGEFRQPQRAEADLRDKIQTIALKNRFYGYRRIGRELWRLHGLKINHKRLRRLMREDNLLCLRSKPFVPYTTNTRHEFPIVPNLTRGLSPTGLDQIWVADITYVRLAGQFVYLAVVLDAFSPQGGRLGARRPSRGEAWRSRRSTWP